MPRGRTLICTLLFSPLAGYGGGMKACEWPVDTQCLPEVKDESLAPVLREAVDTAVAVLWAFTGRRFGVCPAVVRPCPPQTAGVCAAPLPEDNPVCDRTGSVLLPGPVHEVTGFIVGGVEYAVDSLTVEGDRVYRANGEPWPDQNLTVPASSPGGWGISYLRGEPVPAGGGRCVALLAKEFFNACTGGRCQLPRRVQNVSRQGVTVTAVDPADIYEAGSTGLSEVDLWIKAWNPNRLQEPATAWSPDLALW